MNRKSLIRQLEAELRQARKDFKDGKFIPLEEFDWGIPMLVAESREEYRVANEVWTPIAVHPSVSLQLNSIYSYIADNLYNEPAAYHFKAIVKSKFSTISTFPKVGTFILLVADDILKEFSDIRKITVNRYIILYEYHEEIDVVGITHIFHQMQDYGKIFKDR